MLKIIVLIAALFLTTSADAYTIRVNTSSTVHIPGGTYSTPYNANQANTTYILDGNISADSTGIVINASNVVINLNGHTITYNQVSAGVGIGSGDYNYSNVAIVNGSIIQGAAMSDGVVYGTGSNPIRFYAGTPTTYNVASVQIAGITARYGSKDVGGFILGGAGHLIEENTLEDTYEYGVVTDRHIGIPTIRCVGGTSVIRNNTIINARQRGIDATSGDEVHGNTIGIRSLCTNSYGVFTEGSSVKIYNNNITGRGEHPLGIGAHHSTDGTSKDVEIYGNTIDVKTTRIGTEYFGAYPADALTATHTSDVAVGIRSTSGTQNLSVHDNTITAASDSDYMGTYSPDGRSIRINAGARGIMTGLRFNTQSARYYNNTITTLDKDGTGYAAGIACDANIDNNNEYSYRPPAADYAPNLIFNNNTVTSNNFNIVIGDDYGPCHGNPLFIQNTLIKSGSYDYYATYASGQTNYYGGTGRIIANSYQGGSAETNLKMAFESLSNNVPDSGGSYKDKSIIFGDLQADGYLYYRYRLHNSEGTTGSETPINETLNTVGPYYYSVYGPVTTPSKPSGNYKASQSVSLSTNGTSTTYCKSTSANCTPSTSYTTAVKVMVNIPYEKLCYQSTDGTNTEATVCKDYYKREWR